MLAYHSYEDSWDFKNVATSRFCNTRTDTKRDRVNWLTIKWLRYVKEDPETLLFKYRMANDFKQLKIKGSSTRGRQTSFSLSLHTVLSVYAPTLQAETGVKEAFYSDLHNLPQQVDSRDKLLILGDFNARVGRNFELWKGVLRKHGIGNCNDNGRLLLEFCSEHQLVITNTLFQQTDRFKATWRHPRSKH